MYKKRLLGNLTVISLLVCVVGAVFTTNSQAYGTGTVNNAIQFKENSLTRLSLMDATPYESSLIPQAEILAVIVDPPSGLVTTEAGASTNFDVYLDSDPGGDVVVTLNSSDTSEGTVDPTSMTFKTGDYDEPQIATVTGIDDDVDDADQAYTIDLTSTEGNESVSVTNTDDDIAGITVTPTSGLETTEASGNAIFTVVLDSEPTANVVIDISSDNISEGTISPTPLTFTASDWNDAQDVTVTGVDDFVDDGDIAYTVVTSTPTTDDTNYAIIDPDDVSVTNLDDDIAGITVTPTSGLETTEASGNAIFTVVLDSEPTANVVIDISSDNISEGTISPTPLTFTASDWNDAQDVTVTGVDDFVDDGDIAYTVVTSTPTTDDTNYAIIDPDDVSVTNLDNDEVGITVTPTSGLITLEDGTIKPTFTVVLDTQPTANVKINLHSSDDTEGTVSPTLLEFTLGTWSTEKTVTVTGVDDDEADGPVIFSIITDPAESSDDDYSNFNPPDVTVTNSDNDSPGYTIAPLSGLFTTEGGGSIKIKILLQSRPTSDVTLTFISTDPGEGTVDPNSLIVKKEEWAADKIYEFTITGVDDDEIDKPEDMQYNVNVSSSSADTDYDGFTQILIVDNRDAPNITWIKPVTDGLVHEVDNLVPFYLKVDPASIEPIGKVTFNRWDSIAEEYRAIGVDTTNPYRVIINPADLNWEWNQIYAFASPPGSSVTSQKKFIWIFRGELVYRSFMPFLMK